jgi:hypothetical protein
MEPFTKKERKDFNAVIEGTYHGELRNLNYKLVQLQIPEDAAILNDGIYRYKLHGKTEDFESIQKVNDGVGGLEVTIDFLGFCEGVVLPYKGGILKILEIPRTVCMRDGKVFIGEHMSMDKTYLDVFSSIVKTAGEIFRDKRFIELYNNLLFLKW